MAVLEEKDLMHSAVRAAAWVIVREDDIKEWNEKNKTKKQ